MYVTLSLSDFLLHGSTIFLQYYVMHESIIVSCYNIILLPYNVATKYRVTWNQKTFRDVRLSLSRKDLGFCGFIFRPVQESNLSIYLFGLYREYNLSSLMGNIFEKLRINY